MEALASAAFTAASSAKRQILFGCQKRRKDFESFFPTDHRAHQPERNDNGGDRKNAADHGTEVAFIQRGDDCKRMDGRADGAPSHRGGVGDEFERGSLKGFKSKADHEGTGDSDRRAKSGGAFNESPESK